MGFSTVDAVQTALTTNTSGQKLTYNKTLPSTTAANAPHSWFLATGMPPAGTTGTNGKANGRVLTSASTGAIHFNNAQSGKNNWLHTFSSMFRVAGGIGTAILVDRIADCNINHNEATGSITGLTATSRLDSAGGVRSYAQLFIEVTSAFSAGSNTLTFSYTNDAGTSGQITQNVVTTASAIVGRSCNTLLWQGLATGDRGIRSIESVNSLSGSATGAMNLVLCRPLAYVPLNSSGQTIEQDYFLSFIGPEKIPDDACLSIITIPAGAATNAIIGDIKLVGG